MSEDEQPEPRRPLLRVVRGNPDDAEIAALTAVVAALAAGGQEPAEQGPRSQWAARERLLRAPVHPGPGAWRASAMPR